MEMLLPLAGVRCVEHASGVAAAYAGRLLASMGAEVLMIEPREGSPLRREAPCLGTEAGGSALFAYLASGKQSVECDLSNAEGQAAFDEIVASADILIDDTPVADRVSLGLDQNSIAARFADLVHLSVLPFGSTGPKAGWTGSEINLIHASGEGFLLPNGLSATLFPDRPPLKIAGHFAEMQGGIAGALSTLAALWSGIGQYVDVSIQDANLAVGAFTVQRYGDGSLEHRVTRSFRYGGVIECRDGFVELLTLEQRQWLGLVELLGRPEWALDPALEDAVERSTQGEFINEKIRTWASAMPVDDLVAKAQKLGVPMARYSSPEQILAGAQETARGLFEEVVAPDGSVCRIQSAPFRFGEKPLPARLWPADVGADPSVADERRPALRAMKRVQA